MSEFTFDPRENCILVDASVWGPRSHTDLRLLLDTGASQTIVRPEILDDLGYSPRDGDRVAAVSSPVGREYGYTIRLKRFKCLGLSFEDLSVLALDLPEQTDIDGLLGWNFLQNFDYEVQSKRGILRVGLTAST